MSDDQDKSQKTEEPTQKRIDDAVKKGQVATSREVNSFFLLAALTMLVIILGPGVSHDVKVLLTKFITQPDYFEVDKASFQNEMREALAAALGIMFVPAMLIIASIFAANIVQNRYVLSAEPIIPKLEKISIQKGIGRMFSMKSVVEFVKGLLKISIVAIVATVVIWPYKEDLMKLADDDVMAIVAFMYKVCSKMLIGVCIAMFLIALADFAYQKYDYMQNLRMTKQEIKDEYKQQEGDPIVKQRLRQIRRERATAGMMQLIPDADVIITNPSHFSVALKYDTLTMRAPMVIAKGVDKIALRIRERGEECDVPIVRNPPLARLLYDNAEIDQEIPIEYYKLVAEVIGYVYKLKGINIQKPR